LSFTAERTEAEIEQVNRNNTTTNETKGRKHANGVAHVSDPIFDVIQNWHPNLDANK
jgi:hypothetical protein